MPSAGLFVTLYDQKTLALYLDRGVYGQLMSPAFGEPNTRSTHYKALGDYACIRDGTHVFFFRERKIIYGGQVVGSKNFGSFYLNGPYSPIGRKANSKIYWDESKREDYEATDKAGIFNVPQIQQTDKKRCQPYLIRFKDKLDFKGRTISSDDLYFDLGKYGYPLPSNSISGMGFCTLTPGETEIAISLFRKSTEILKGKSDEKVYLEDNPLQFDPKYGISSLREAVSEAHLEASVLANPDLLPAKLRPAEATLCRQVPISPFKPLNQFDRADICYFSEDGIAEGTVPNTILELKNEKAGKSEVAQIKRYADWLYRIVPPKEASRISFYLIAPSFTNNAKQAIPSKYRSQIELIEFSQSSL